MPDYKDTASRLREAAKRTDLPTGVSALLSEAYGEIVRLEERIKDFKEGFEGSCTACEVVGLGNKRLREERDEARQRYCIAVSEHGESAEAQQIAKDEGWDCFNV